MRMHGTLPLTKSQKGEVKEGIVFQIEGGEGREIF